MASSESSAKKDKNQNIQVFVRLRPLNQRERAIRSLGVVEVINNKEVVVRQSPQTSHTKKFTFDRAFGPNAEQVEVYKEVVSPLIAEVLAGYNCTVFAYGQTGTGKTHTMVGESTGEGTTWQNDPLAGIIPRALSQLFDELRISNAEYTVRVSYLELYNEELFDLLSTSNDNSKLRIYEDITRKGSTIVNGLEETTVRNKNEVYEIMAQGQERKRVASTLMNAQSSNHPNDKPSSRSHTVFTIVVHMKENCPKGEELVKIGKLNLVDLAGSENISKAGSDNPAKKERARECVNINQSLLTLGRVITALVEKHPHIPYRESKLTRILQESLGGRTKTSIIATISPGHKDLEETMSTLEYAHRAKNIQNKPEINQKLTKQAILKEFSEEIDKLKRELTATREKNGVYLPSETYVEMTLKYEDQRREIAELLLKKRAMEDERARMEAVFTELDQRCALVQEELAGTRTELQRTAQKLAETEQHSAEQEHLLDAHQQTESRLTAQAQQLVATADEATRDVACLHDTVDRRKTLETVNQQVVCTYREESNAQRTQIADEVQEFTDQFMAERDHMQTNVDDFARDASMTQEASIQDMKLLIAKMDMFMNQTKSMTEDSESYFSGAVDACRSTVSSKSASRREALQAVMEQLMATITAGVQRAAASNVVATVAGATDRWVHDASSRVQSLQKEHKQQSARLHALENRREAGARAHHTGRLTRLKKREDDMNDEIQGLQEHVKAIEVRITQQQSLIDTERNETEQRLQKWLDKERMFLEEYIASHVERMTSHVAEERNATNARLDKLNTELELYKQMLQEATERCSQIRQAQHDFDSEEKEKADAELEQFGNENKECLKCVDEFGKEFDEGTSAITAEMEALGRSMVQIVDHANDQMMTELKTSQNNLEDGVKAVLECDMMTAGQCLSATMDAVTGVVDNSKHNINAMLENITNTSTSTISTLNDLSERMSRLASSSLDHQSVQTSALGRAAHGVERLAGDVRAGLQRLADAERRYLMAEYRVYEPTGNTPARREFRIPRRLAVTSPHDRILARFRAEQRRAAAGSPDSDCVLVVESDEGRHTSDSDVSESSVSEDSAVAMQ